MLFRLCGSAQVPVSLNVKDDGGGLADRGCAKSRSDYAISDHAISFALNRLTLLSLWLASSLAVRC